MDYVYVARDGTELYCQGRWWGQLLGERAFKAYTWIFGLCFSRLGYFRLAEFWQTVVSGFHLAVLMKHYRLRHRCQGLCAINGAWCALGEECKGNSNWK